MSVFKRYIGQDQAEPTTSHTPVPETRMPEPSAPATAPAQASARPSATRNILSSDVEIKGSVKFTNDLVIDGKIEGDIQSNGNLTVGENARIKAEIKTATVVVYGKVHGNIIAADRVDLKSTAEVIGDIKAKTLSVEPGAVFVGKSIIGAPQEAAAPAASSAKPISSAPQATSSAPAPAAAKPAGQPEAKQATLPGTQL
jgi:cytoskeletal protein CcmA (bactofilin family)